MEIRGVAAEKGKGLEEAEGGKSPKQTEIGRRKERGEVE